MEWWRSGGVLGEPFEVLNAGGQKKLVLGAFEAAQSEPGHGEDMLGLTKEGFDLLALEAGVPIGVGLHQGLSIISGLLIDVS